MTFGQSYVVFRKYFTAGSNLVNTSYLPPRSPKAFISPCKGFSKAKTSTPGLVYCLPSNWANPTYWSTRSAGPNSIIFGSFDSARKTLHDEPSVVRIQSYLAKNDVYRACSAGISRGLVRSVVRSLVGEPRFEKRGGCGALLKIRPQNLRLVCSDAVIVSHSP